MKKLSVELENSVVVLTEKGHSTRKIAEKLNIGQSTVVKVQKRKNIVRAPNVGGRPRQLSDADARLMEREMRKDSSITPKQAADALNKNVSEWTARRALHRIGLLSAVKKKKPALSAKNVKARLAFCKKHVNWSVEDWRRVIWSDEVKINRFQSDGISYYWRRPKETIQRHHVKQTVKHGGGSLMVWGCFTWHNIGPIVKISGIMKKEDYLDILKSNLPDFVQSSPYSEEQVIFQQDGDPKHTAKIVKEWFSQQTFKLMEWPAQSPDLNPIENLWSILKKRLGKYKRAPENMDELWRRVQFEWGQIPDNFIQNLVESMPKRMKGVIKNKGLWTKY